MQIECITLTLIPCLSCSRYSFPEYMLNVVVSSKEDKYLLKMKSFLSVDGWMDRRRQERKAGKVFHSFPPVVGIRLISVADILHLTQTKVTLSALYVSV